MMHRTLLSLALLASAFAAPPAWAQLVVGRQVISDHDLPYVQSRCATLERKQNSLAGSNLDMPFDFDPPPGSMYSTEPDQIDEALTRANLAAISLKDCRAAGLV